MDFCDDCGILLPMDLESDCCNPCGEVRKKRRQVKMPCECELCYNKGFKSPLSTQDGNCQGTHSEYSDDISKPKPRVRPESSRDHGAGEPSRHKKIHAKSPPHTSMKPADNLMRSDPPGSSDSVSEGWTVVSKGKKEDKKAPEHKKDLAEDLVASDIREKWEREQKDYKTQLCKTDTPTISALVGGCRRKQNDGRFFVGGVDISFIKGNSVDACACLTVVQMPDLKMVYQRMEMIALTQPYIPGFLAFREVPPLADLYHQMEKAAPQYLPDVIMVDGNGTLHPRGFGLACQLGVILDVPTLGVAKTLMTAQGIVDDDAHKKRKKKLTGAGDGFDLVSDSGEVLGRCVQVHDQAPNPVYISVGHKISLDSAVWLALECSKFRIPEPVRRADLDSREYLRQDKRDLQEFIKA